MQRHVNIYRRKVHEEPKKVLAVVLVVALAFSLASVAFAADINGYSDKDTITEKEAVNVLTYAGVLSGSDGKVWTHGHIHP